MLSDRANDKRKAQARARRAAPPAAVQYAPGHFTAPVRAWWPGWTPYDLSRFDRGAFERALRASRVADDNRRLARGFGSGTMDLPRTPENPAPRWMTPGR